MFISSFVLQMFSNLFNNKLTQKWHRYDFLQIVHALALHVVLPKTSENITLTDAA